MQLFKDTHLPKTREIGKNLLKKGQTWMVTLRVPEDLKDKFGVSRLKKSLKTTDLAIAERRKVPLLAHWKLLFDLARENPDAVISDIDQTSEIYRNYLLRLESEVIDSGKGMALVAQPLNPFAPGIEQEEQFRRAEVFIKANDLNARTIDHVDEFVDQYNWAPAVAQEARTYLKETFAFLFPIFEEIDQSDIRNYCDGRLRGTDGKQAWARASLKKYLNYARTYWEYCYERHTSAPNLVINADLLPKEGNTKAVKMKRMNSNLPYSVEDAHALLNGAIARNDQPLEDLIRLGMYTGCRINELCSMKLSQVTEDAFQIDDSKTPDGIRRIPIHADIQQMLERLKQTSTDGYLLSGQSNNNQFGVRHTGLQQKFSRLKQALGFGQKVYTFHSFRSTLANQFESAGVPETHAARIIGHQVNSMTYGVYSQSVRWDVLVDAMKVISYKLPGN